MKCPKCGAALPEGAKFCGNCGARLTPPAEPTQQVTVKAPTLPVAPVPEEVTAVQPDLGAAAKKGPRGKLVGIAAAVVVLLLVILAGLFFVLGRGGSGKNTYVLLQDGKYELLSSLKKTDLVEIASAKSEDSTDGLVQFSKDGKYLYFFTKYDSDNYTGTLCRAEYAKLKDGSSKNDKYITTIASNVKLWFYETKNGLLYNNDAGTLYYYNGSEAVQLAKNASVASDVDSDTNEILYTRDNDDDTEDLYYVSLDKPEDPKKLEGKIAGTISTSDLKNILYTKGSDEDGYALYRTSIDGEPEKIANKYRGCYNDATNGKLFYLKDTGKTVSLYDFVYDPYNVTEEPDWSDYRMLDSDGWYTYDDEGYSEAWDHYSMRKDLTSEDNALPLYDLYYYANGQETLVAQEVLSTQSAGNGFVYWGADMLEDQISIDDLDDAYDLRWTVSYLEDYFMDDVDASKLSLYSETANTTVPLTEDTLELMQEGEHPGLYCYCVKDQLILSPNDYGEAGALYAATIKNGELGGFTQIADDAEIETYDEDRFYYTTGEYDKDDNSYADLYCYENGEPKRVAQDALGDEMVRIYEDGVISLYTDHNQNGYELTLLQKDGTKNLIADDVTEYLRVDEDNLLYLSDGDLYCYDGKEKKRVATDVDYFWAKSSAELDRSIWL